MIYLRKKILYWLVVLAGFNSTLQGIEIDDFTTETNDRFDNDSTFVADGLDLSGVGMTSSGLWATMVSENVFLSANHYHPAVGDVVTFYATNDPSGSSITRSVQSGQGIGTTDIWVGVLDSPVAVGFEYYEIANSSSIGEDIYMLGRSVNNYSSVQEDVAVGKNILDGYAPSTTVSGSIGDAYYATYNSPVGVTYESLLETGDSGAPLFTSDTLTNELTLVGTNWFVGEVEVGPGITSEISGFTDLSSEYSAIQAIISANAVPEPSSAVLFSLGGLLLLGVRGR